MSDWTLPDDLRRVTVHGDHNVGISVSHFDGPTYLTASDNPDVASVLVTADDLRTIAARLVTIADAIDPPPHNPDAEEWRSSLLDLMSAYSEDRWCAGWMGGLDEELHAIGGLWEVMGRAVGWPVGYRAEDGWMTWDAAGALYAERPA